MGPFCTNDFSPKKNEPKPGRELRKCTNEFDKPFQNND